MFSTSSSVFREIYATFVIAHGNLLNGSVFAFSAFLIPQLRREGFDMNAATNSWIGSVVCLVAAFSAFGSSFLMTSFGRLRNQQIALVLYTIGCLVISYSPNIPLICLGLGIAGVAFTLSIPLLMTYVSETCNKKRRGLLVSCEFIFISLGNSVDYILDSYLPWRTCATILASVAVVALLQTFLIPETKYWYILQDKPAKAVSSMRWFEPHLNEAEMASRIQRIRDSIESTSKSKEGVGRLDFIKAMGQTKFMKPFALGVILFSLRSGSGRVIVAAYTVNFFEDLKTPYDSESLAAWYGICDFFGCVVVLLVVYKLGRKTVFYIYSAVIAATLLATIWYEAYGRANFASHAPWFPVICMYVYGTVISSGFMCNVTIIVSEIQFAQFRGEILTVLMFVSYSTIFLYAQLYARVEYVVPVSCILGVFLVNVLLAALVVFFFIPETSKEEFYETGNLE